MSISPEQRQVLREQLRLRSQQRHSREEAAEIVAKRRAEREAREQAEQGSQPKRRFPRWRWWLWALEALVLLAVVEQRFLHRRRTTETETAESVRRADEGLPVYPVSSGRELPEGLSEILPSFYVSPERFPAECRDFQAEQRRVSEEEGLPVEVENSLGMRFRLVPAGTCLIGSPETEVGRGETEFLHPSVFGRHFYLGKFEVTQREWRELMGSENNPSRFQGDNLPVEEVTWYDCQEFIRRLNEREGLSRQNGYRLPTEEEWEYACRGGAMTAFCFGDKVSQLGDWADFADNNYAATAKVGKRRPNILGLYDMHGNVWEWCQDLFKNYPGDDTPLGQSQEWRNVRGGNWYVTAAECRSANRCRLPPLSQGNMLGFRVLRQIAEQPALE